MTITRIFNGTSTNGIGITSNFSNANALYMVAPDITDEIELDFYLQFAISPTDNRLLKLNENFTLDTLSIYVIPEELKQLDKEFYGVFTTSSPVTVEIWVMESENSLQCDLEEVLQAIRDFRTQFTIEQVRQIATDAAFAIAEGQQNIALGFLAGSLAPITAGASLATLAPLGTANLTLTPITLGAGFLLP
jgi:hypothetical protein